MYKGTTELPGCVGSFDSGPEGTNGETIKEFVERMEALEGGPRRRQQGPPRVARSVPRKATASDGRGGGAKIELVLYTCPGSEKSQRALRAVHAVLADYERSQIKFTVCDLTDDGAVEADGIVFTPTLVKQSPGPRTWIVGNLEHRDLLIDLLEVSGVERRKS